MPPLWMRESRTSAFILEQGILMRMCILLREDCWADISYCGSLTFTRSGQWVFISNTNDWIKYLQLRIAIAIIISLSKAKNKTNIIWAKSLL